MHHDMGVIFIARAILFTHAMSASAKTPDALVEVEVQTSSTPTKRKILRKHHMHQRSKGLNHQQRQGLSPGLGTQSIREEDRLAGLRAYEAEYNKRRE